MTAWVTVRISVQAAEQLTLLRNHMIRQAVEWPDKEKEDMLRGMDMDHFCSYLIRLAYEAVAQGDETHWLHGKDRARGI